MKKLLPMLVVTPVVALALFLGHGQVANAAEKAPAFALKSATDGKTHSLEEFKGKVRIVDYWATWCPPCRAEIPDFVSLQKQYGAKGLQVIGVSVDKGGTPGVVQFMKENHINYPIVMSESAIESAYGGIRAIPTTFLIDRQGTIVKKYVGGIERAQFEKDLKALL
jgi:thiol-disulfide isomerase/thioredoxin